MTTSTLRELLSRLNEFARGKAIINTSSSSGVDRYLGLRDLLSLSLSNIWLLLFCTSCITLGSELCSQPVGVAIESRMHMKFVSRPRSRAPSIILFQLVRAVVPCREIVPPWVL